MKVFDFDNTIYDGESSLDFFLYCLKRKKSLVKYMPEVLHKAAKYKAGKIQADEVYAFCGKMLGVFLDNCGENIVPEFWEVNGKKLKKKFLDMITGDDVIISASPRFLLSGAADMLKTDNIICTEIDEKERRIKFLCYGKNKIEAFYKAYPDAVIDEFYSDSVYDMPMMKAAEKAYLVKGDKISEILS